FCDISAVRARRDWAYGGRCRAWVAGNAGAYSAAAGRKWRSGVFPALRVTYRRGRGDGGRSAQVEGKCGFVHGGAVTGASGTTNTGARGRRGGDGGRVGVVVVPTPPLAAEAPRVFDRRSPAERERGLP